MHDFASLHDHRGARLLALALAGLTLTACPADDETPAGSSADASASESGDSSADTDAADTDSHDSDSHDSDAADTTTGALTYSLSGTIGRTVELARGNDGVGTLVIGAFAECGLGQSLLASAVVPGADLSDPAARIAFTLEGLPPGPVHVGLFLDDNGDLDPKAPHPGEGDLVYGFDPCDGDLDCVALEIADADLVDVALDLNLLELDVCP